MQIGDVAQIRVRVQFIVAVPKSAADQFGVCFRAVQVMMPGLCGAELLWAGFAGLPAILQAGTLPLAKAWAPLRDTGQNWCLCSGFGHVVLFCVSSVGPIPFWNRVLIQGWFEWRTVSA